MKRAPRMEIMWRGQLGNENDGPAVERSGAPDDERNQHRGRLEYDHGFNEVNRGMIMVSGGILRQQIGATRRAFHHRTSGP